MKFRLIKNIFNLQIRNDFFALQKEIERLMFKKVLTVKIILKIVLSPIENPKKT